MEGRVSKVRSLTWSPGPSQPTRGTGLTLDSTPPSVPVRAVWSPAAGGPLRVDGEGNAFRMLPTVRGPACDDDDDDDDDAGNGAGAKAGATALRGLVPGLNGIVRPAERAERGGNPGKDGSNADGGTQGCPVSS